MNIKDVIKWGGLLILIWTTLFFANEFFIRDWRIQYSEKRVQKSIVENYAGKEEQFRDLINYVRKLDLPIMTDIEFTKGAIINGFLNSSSIPDSLDVNLAAFNLTTYDFEEGEIWPMEFEFLPDGKVKVDYGDSIMVTNNWYWSFEGGSDHPQFKKLIDYLGVTKNELDVLRSLTKEANCEAISINHDGSFSLRYDGIRFCQYEYLISKWKLDNYKNYIKLDDEIFYGLNHWDLFCGYVIFDK